MNMKSVLNLMTPNPKMIQSGESLQDVVRLFLEKGITSSPIVNPLGEILGVLTELGLLKAFMLHKAKFHKNDKVGHHIDLLEPVTLIDQKASLSDILREMIAAPTHRLLITDEKKKVIGIISPKDLLRVMSGEDVDNVNIKEKLVETESKLKESIHRVEQLEKYLEVYQQVFHETPYMMHAVDQNGKILMANKREHEVLGYDDGTLIGKTIFDIYSAPMHDEARRGLQRILNEGHHHVTYTTLVRKDGSLLRCDIASSSMRDENGKFLSTISVLRPVDSEELLRALNGVVSDESGPLARYANVPNDKKD